MLDRLQQEFAKCNQIVVRPLAIAGLGMLILVGATGCGGEPPKDLSASEVEEIRQEHEAMSQREMSNE